MTDEQFNKLPKLPKWAQQEIQVLRMRVAEYQKTILEMIATEDKASKIVVYPTHDLARHMPSDSRVRFVFGANSTDYIDVNITSKFGTYDRGEGNFLHLTTGTSCIKINPSSSNSVYVSIDKERE